MFLLAQPVIGFMLSTMFAISFVGKVRDFSGFLRTIGAWFAVPKSLISSVGLTIMLCELATAILLGVQQDSMVGWVLGLLLLTIFTGAMGLVLAQQKQVRCHCFGAGATMVSAVDLARNAVLIALGIVGATLCASSHHILVAHELLLSLAPGIFFALLIVHFNSLWATGSSLSQVMD
jgi:Methylamine utilisation protein MauE